MNLYNSARIHPVMECMRLLLSVNEIQMDVTCTDMSSIFLYTVHVFCDQIGWKARFVQSDCFGSVPFKPVLNMSFICILFVERSKFEAEGV
jgi:hypothetical protein